MKLTKIDREAIILEIAREIEDLGAQTRFMHVTEISAHRLQDWGVRLRMLVTASRIELEENIDEIRNGNPAKYQ